MAELSKILFVDDDELVSEFSVMIMEASGFEVCYCDSGQKALQETIGFKPDLILLDVLMPDMDGIETFKKLRELPQSANVPVVFLTGKANGGDAQKYEAMGALGLIGKPFDPNNLCDAINALWEKHDG